ncbi:MAG TPA: hypothetical protein VJH95_01155 [Candidatus Nanoarchaeia archaeon]|nr:hypothetical protein [Candidatus Nanoarchaeia archaeon]
MSYNITALPEGSGYKLLKPIEVELTKEDGSFFARAPSTLLFSGRQGSTPGLAINSLAEFIVSSYTFCINNPDNPSWRGFRAFVKPRLEGYLEVA